MDESYVTYTVPPATAASSRPADWPSDTNSGVASVNADSPGARRATWIRSSRVAQTRAAVPSSPVTSCSWRASPAKVCAGPKSPVGGATRTETFSVVVLAGSWSIQATTREPSGRSATRTLDATWSAGDSGGLPAQPAACAAGARVRAPATASVHRNDRRYIRITSIRP